LKVEKDPKAIYDQLVKVFLNVMDTNWIGKFVLGPKWNEVPESTQRDYISAYQNYLSSFYAIKFRQYNNQKVSISNVRKAPGDQYIVSTDIRDNSLRKPINISYRIKESSGQYKIRDIVIEGVSILSAQRSEFAKVVINSGVPKLIQLLNAKASQNAASIRK